MIRIAIIEDEPAELSALSRLVDSWSDGRCVGAFRTAESAIRQFDNSRPDLVIVDLGLPRMDGVACVWKLRGKHPGLPILVHTIESDISRVFQAIQAGAAGYLLKGVPSTILRQAVHDILAGGSVMTPSIARQVLGWFQRSPVVPPHAESLSQREHEVLKLLTRGYRNEEIATELQITTNTVKTHIRHIYEILHVHSRGELFARLLELGSPTDPDAG
ncbi:MAG: response regulator transcription factor [Verrucomicrobiales bacterium]|nr:response regulator transcription factor [Verrucomicrobiales bacterium]